MARGNLRIRLGDNTDIESLRELLYYQNLSQIPKDNEIMLAEENHRVLGAVTVGYKNFRYMSKTNRIRVWNPKRVETNAWIFRLFVREDQRSRGIGKLLVMNMVAHLEKKGTRTFYAGIAPGEFKEASRNVFSAAGFVDAGSCVCLRRFCVGTLMKLQL